MKTIKTSKKKPIPKLMVVIEGGNVQHFCSTHPVDLLIVDWDNAKAGAVDYLDDMGPVRVHRNPGGYANAVKEAKARLGKMVSSYRKLYSGCPEGG